MLLGGGVEDVVRRMTSGVLRAFAFDVVQSPGLWGYVTYLAVVGTGRVRRLRLFDNGVV